MPIAKWFLFCGLVNLIFFVQVGFAQESGKMLVKRGDISEDIYLAGAQVNVNATVKGDVIVAGGRILVEGSVSDDLIAAGGNITVNADINDDARLAGGQILISSKIGDNLVAAGGNLTLGSASSVGNKAWLSGANVEINGRIGNELTIRAGRVVIAGEVLGDVLLYANTIEVLPGAIISGDFSYRSQSVANIHDGASIKGKIEQLPVADWRDSKKDGWQPVGLLLFIIIPISILFTVIILYLLMPMAFDSMASMIKIRFLQTMAVGLITFLAVPVVTFLLAITIIGLPLALLSLLIYLLLLVFGYFSGIFYISDQVLNHLFKNKEKTKKWRVLSILIAVFLIFILTFVPLLGGLVLYLLFLLGLGSVVFYALNRFGFNLHKA
jgi:cytoskeletal protein CcmA (bactofilin family)